MRSNQGKKQKQNNRSVWPVDIKCEDYNAFPAGDRKQTNSPADNYTLPVWDRVYCGADFGNRFLTVVNFIYKMLEGVVLPLTKN